MASTKCEPWAMRTMKSKAALHRCLCPPRVWLTPSHTSKARENAWPTMRTVSRVRGARTRVCRRKGACRTRGKEVVSLTNLAGWGRGRRTAGRASKGASGRAARGHQGPRAAHQTPRTRSVLAGWRVSQPVSQSVDESDESDDSTSPSIPSQLRRCWSCRPCSWQHR